MKRRTLIRWAALALLPPVASRASAAQVQMMGPEESIALEHQTRSIRLRRLVREIGVSPPPEFFEYVIPARAMPPGFQYDTPVLRVVFPENTFFDTAKSDIVPSAMPIVEAMARMLEGDVPDVALFIAGHTDNRGSEEYNHNLSVQRARTVAQALRLAGAGAPDIWSVGFGESLPLYANNSPLNMAYNRRVEFLFGARPEAVANWLKDQLDFACSGSTDVERLHCLSTLKVRKTYVVDPVERSVLVAPDRPKSKIVTPQTHQVTVTPPHRQIVINLAERSYVVRRPET